MLCRTVFSGLLVASCCICTAQPAWAPAGLQVHTGEVTNIYEDTVANALYYCGESSRNGDNDFSDQVLSIYSNGQWDTLGSFTGRVTAAVTWHDTLVVAGYFFSVDGMPMEYVTCYVGQQWLPFGDFSEGVYRLKIINGDLYAIGAIQFADGHLCNGITKRVGGEWVNVGVLDAYNIPIFQDLVEWNGTLYAAGAIRFNGTPYKDLVYFNGTEWLPLSTGILGGLGAGRSLAVYQDELYIGG